MIFYNYNNLYKLKKNIVKLNLSMFDTLYI